MNQRIFIETRDVLTGKAADAAIDTKVWQRASSELSEYVGKDIKAISDEFWKDKKSFDHAEQRAIENEPTKHQIETYYRNTRKYLYECMCWEAYKSKQRDFKKIFLTLRKSGINNVLDFGGGTGGLVLYLSERGIRCDYLDLKGETSDFARWRFERNSLDINIRRDIKEYPADFYGAVLSDNVFEHIFDLEDVIQEIHRVLYGGGLLIARSSFGGGGAHLRKNDKYSQFEVYDRLMTDRGFDYYGQLKDDFLTREIDKHIRNYWILSVYVKKRRKYGGNFLIHQKLPGEGHRYGGIWK